MDSTPTQTPRYPYTPLGMLPLGFSFSVFSYPSSAGPAQRCVGCLALPEAITPGTLQKYPGPDPGLTIALGAPAPRRSDWEQPHSHTLGLSLLASCHLADANTFEGRCTVPLHPWGEGRGSAGTLELGEGQGNMV